MPSWTTWSKTESPKAGCIRTAMARPTSWRPTTLPKDARRTVASNCCPNNRTHTYNGALAISRAPRKWNRWCERGDLNPHALRHRILSPARLPFRHSRALVKLLECKGLLKGQPSALGRKLLDLD